MKISHWFTIWYGFKLILNVWLDYVKLGYEVREKKNFLKAAFHGKWSTHLLVEVKQEAELSFSNSTCSSIDKL